MITFDKENRPGVSALLTTAALTTGRTEEDIAAEIGNDGAGALKRYVTESVNAYLAPIRERRRELEGQPEIWMRGNMPSENPSLRIASTSIFNVDCESRTSRRGQASATPRDHGAPSPEGAPFSIPCPPGPSA